MGKRQHQKDKMYLTYTEWTTLYGGKKEGPEKDRYKRLPFDHCCVSLQPFEQPCCDRDGNIFDLQAVLGYIKKFKHNPVTGKPLDANQLVLLKIAKNINGEYHCPVLFKVFTNQSYVVANAKTRNVFSFEAIEQLNIKTKSYRDLLTDEPYNKNDLIELQNPADLSKFNLTNFHHVKNNLRMETEEEIEIRTEGSMAILKTVSHETKDILHELDQNYKPEEEKKKPEIAKPKLDKFNAANYSTGAVAAAFTSTVIEPKTIHEAAVIDEDLVRYERVKKKGYVRLVTNFGPLNIQLHSDIVPRTCENFLKLCQRGYYDNTKFHRSIRNFMIQGGDPTGTGKGGESIWGKDFQDEFKVHLNHNGRGILSMANCGPNTNRSQFFITFRSCRHLDKKHTVFGKVVGGIETLTALEMIEVDNKDRPIEDIIIVKTQTFIDPYQEADEKLAAERAAEEEKKKVEEAAKNLVPVGSTVKTFKAGPGKYINPEITNMKSEEAEEVSSPIRRKKKKGNYDFGGMNFWN